MINFEEKYVIGCSFNNNCLVLCACKNYKIELVTFDFVNQENYEFFFNKKMVNFFEQLQIDFLQIDKIVSADKVFSSFLLNIQEHSLKFPFGFNFFLNNFPKQVLKNFYLKDFITMGIYNFFWQKNKPVSKGYIIDDINNKILFARADFALIAGAYGLAKEDNLAIFYLNKEYQENSVVLANVVDNQKKFYKTINFPHSLHYLKETLSCYFYENYPDFKVTKNNQRSSEKICQALINDLIFIEEDGSFFLNFQYLKLTDNKYVFTKKFKKFLEQKIFFKKQPDLNEINTFLVSVEEIIKRIIIAMLKHLQQISSVNNLVILECSIINIEMLEIIRKENIFKEVHFQPYRKEVLKTIGSSLIGNYQKDNKISKIDINKLSNFNCLNSFNSKQTRDSLKNIQAKYLSVFDDEFVNILFENLQNEKIILWFSNDNISDYSLGNKGLLACFTQKNIERLKSLQTNNSSLICLKDNLLNFYPLDEEINYKKIVDNKQHLKELFKITISSSNLFHRIVEKYHIANKFPFLINSQVESLIQSSSHENHEQIANYYHFFTNNDLDILVVDNFILFKEDQF